MPQIWNSDHPRHICCVSPKWSHSGTHMPQQGAKNYFDEFNFMAVSVTINCTLKHLIMLNIPLYIFSVSFIPYCIWITHQIYPRVQLIALGTVPGHFLISTAVKGSLKYFFLLDISNGEYFFLIWFFIVKPPAEIYVLNAKYEVNFIISKADMTHVYCHCYCIITL